MTTPAGTSTDIDGIRSLLEEMLREGKSSEIVELMVSLLRQLKTDNDRLQARLGKLLADKFGRRSEKIPVEQLRLFIEQLAEPEVVVAPAAPASLAAPRRASLAGSGHKGRKPLPDSLPRERIALEPADDQKVCPQCGAPKTRIGHDKSQVLEFVPAQFKVLVYERAKYACRSCETGVVVAPVAAKPIESGLPGFGLMADVLVKKYADHCPLHRIRSIYRRQQVELAVSTLASWVAAGAEALEPIAAAIRDKTLSSHVVQTDDTGLRVLDPAHKGGSKRGHMWSYLGDLGWLSFHYTPTWEAEGPCAFLAGRCGWVQADAYAGYDRLFDPPDSLAVEVGCWAHCRRYYVEALPADARAAVAIHYIGQLYDVERHAKQSGLEPAGRLALRRERSEPVLEAIGKWVQATWPKAVPKSPLGQALTYTVNQWEALRRFLQDGRLEIDNNACERALRQVAVGRKNWLFAGSDEGARRAAVIYTVMGTCRLHGVDPWAYVRDVLEKLATGWLQSRVEELLPPNWARANQPPDQQAQPAALAAS